MRKEANLRNGFHRKPKLGATYTLVEWASSPHVPVPQEQQNSAINSTKKRKLCYGETEREEDVEKGSRESSEDRTERMDLGDAEAATRVAIAQLISR